MKDVFKLNMGNVTIEQIKRFAEIQKRVIKEGDLVYCQQNGDEPREVIEICWINNHPVMKVRTIDSKVSSVFITQNGWHKK